MVIGIINNHEDYQLTIDLEGAIRRWENDSYDMGSDDTSDLIPRGESRSGPSAMIS